MTTYNAQALLIDSPEPVARACRLPRFTVSLVRDGGVKAESPICDRPERAEALLRPLIGSSDREHLVAILLDARQKVLGLNMVSMGTATASLVHPREVFKPAILAGASAMIVAHNHPSGDWTPSPEDKDATRRLQKAGELLGVPVLDHVIIGQPSVEGGRGWYSFREAGLL